jgi:hypothetical protein
VKVWFTQFFAGCITAGRALLGLGLQNIIMFSFHHETDTLIAYEKVREHVLMKIPIFDHFILYDAPKSRKRKSSISNIT